MSDSNGVEVYKATLKFVRSLLGLAALVFIAWLVIPKMGGFCRWVGGLDPKILMMVVVAPVAGVVLIAGFAIYAVFFKGANFVKDIVNSETAKEAVKIGAKVRVKPQSHVDIDISGAEG